MGRPCDVCLSECGRRYRHARNQAAVGIAGGVDALVHLCRAGLVRGEIAAAVGRDGGVDSSPGFALSHEESAGAARESAGDGDEMARISELARLGVDIDVLENATAALACLTSACEDNGARVGDAGGIAVLVRLTRSVVTAENELVHAYDTHAHILYWPPVRHYAFAYPNAQVRRGGARERDAGAVLQQREPHPRRGYPAARDALLLVAAHRAPQRDGCVGQRGAGARMAVCIHVCGRMHVRLRRVHGGMHTRMPAYAYSSVAQDETNRGAAGAAGAVEALVHAASQEGDEVCAHMPVCIRVCGRVLIQMQVATANACWALGNLAWNTANQERVGRFFPALVGMCASDNVRAAPARCKCVRVVCVCVCVCV